jgi:hypothetical protein
MSKLAAVHGGVITAAQCRTLGVDDASVRRLLSAGLWTRARRGIYADVAFTPRIPEPAGPGPSFADDPLEGDVHVVDYDDADVLDVAGVPVLSRARLVLDCCDVLPADSALAVADAALARNLTTSTALDAALRRRRTRSRTADRVAALVVDRADPLAANWFEADRSRGRRGRRRGQVRRFARAAARVS